VTSSWFLIPQLLLFIYFTISRGTLNDILRNHGGETLLYSSISVSVRLSAFLPGFL